MSSVAYLQSWKCDPTDGSTNIQKGGSCGEFATLVLMNEGSDTAVLAGDLGASGLRLGERCQTRPAGLGFSSFVQRELFLFSAYFRHSSGGTATWRSNLRCTFKQINHTAVSQC